MKHSDTSGMLLNRFIVNHLSSIFFELVICEVKKDDIFVKSFNLFAFSSNLSIIFPNVSHTSCIFFDCGPSASVKTFELIVRLSSIGNSMARKIEFSSLAGLKLNLARCSTPLFTNWIVNSTWMIEFKWQVVPWFWIPE